MIALKDSFSMLKKVIRVTLHTQGIQTVSKERDQLKVKQALNLDDQSNKISTALNIKSIAYIFTHK